jgi:G3E family GTPase
MKYIGLMLVFLCVSSAAAQVHQHRSGQAFVVQQQQQWQVELILPAADVLGFEYAPSTDQEKQKVSEFEALANKAEQLVTLPNCQLTDTDVKIALGETVTDHKAHHHKSHQHDHHKDHDHSHHDNSEQEMHSDIELSYRFSCQQKPDSIAFPLFEQFSSLENLKVQWITEKGQGALSLTSSQPLSL